MAKEFVPSPAPLNVGELFAKTQKLYTDIKVLQGRVEALVVQLSDTEYASEARNLLSKVKKLRLRAMAATVQTIGKLVTDIEEARSKITLGEAGLAEVDARIEGLRERNDKVYRTAFKWAGGVPLLPNPTDWGDEEWAEFEKRLEGPIYYWGPKECLELWSYPVPRCQGPDYLTAWSLVNQVIAAQDTQAVLVGDVAGYLDWQMGGYVEEAATAFEELVQKTKEVVSDVVEYTQERLIPPFMLGLGIVVGVVGLGFVAQAWAGSRRGRR